MATMRKKRSWVGATIVTFVLTGALVALAVVSQEDGKIHIDRVAMPEQLQRCSADTDCLLVDQISCCACQAAGGQGAINSTQQDGLRRFLKTACRHRGVCVSVDTCQGDLAAACVEGRCIVRADHG
jgi:hypothetical protein